MQNIHDEEILGKAYDARLMRRLLTYAKPFTGWIALCVLLLFIITGLELVRPYLIKTAIDDHINAISRPYLVTSVVDCPDQGVIFDGQRYIRSDELDPSLLPPDTPRAQILQQKNRYYLIPGAVPEGATYTIKPAEYGLVTVRAENGDEWAGRELNSVELRTLRTPDANAVFWISIAFLGTILLNFLLNYGQVYLLQWTSQQIVFSIRQQLFAHIEKLSLTFFDKNPVGRLVTRVTNDIETLNEMYTSVLVNLFKDVFMLVGILIVMMNLNFRLALYSFSVLPLIFISSIIYRRYAREAYRNVRLRLARLNATLAENISGMKLIQIFHQEKKKFREFDEINQSYYQASKQELLSFAIFRPVMEIISSLGLSIIVWFGGKQVIQGNIEFGVLFAFISYIQSFFRPILDLTEKYNILQAAMASSERIFMLLDEKETILNPALPEALGEIAGSIEFKNVWFAYNHEDWVLRDVSFTVNPGETVAFVGATGAGKSSIISLLSRFYDIQKGQILIDGKDIRTIDKYELRRKIGVVLQDVFLFTGDIKSNIRLNNPEISDDEIRQVAAYVNADHFIRKLPQGYDEPVTERGSTLSAGQRQLLAFARTLAFDPAILVLDEATANIDTETELLIQDALKKLIRDRTTLVVAHRLSTIQHADTIIVLHKGQIREMGNHQELLAKEGIYYKLYQLQYKEDFAAEESAG